MTIDELRRHLAHLVDAYVTDGAKKEHLHSLVSRHDVPAKGIMAELEPFLAGKISPEDATLIKEIAYYFI
jgi:hypothetical protein